MDLDPAGARWRRVVGYAACAAVYLLLSVALWWHMWGHPATTVASGSADVAQGVWWMAWMPHSLGAGIDPFFSRTLYWPGGVNLLSNTSVLLVSLVMSPVTVVFGPIVSFNVAVTLAPVLDALALCVVVRRWVTFLPAAFLGGLLYGFGPFVATDLRYGHLNLTVLLFPPIVLALMRRILVDQDGSPVRAGVWLGVVLVAQFFVSTEMLALMLVVAVLGVFVVAVGGRRVIGQKWRFASRALGAAAAVAVPLLAFPTWWFLHGPRHFVGAVWGDMSRFATSLEALAVPHGQLVGVSVLSGGNGGFLGVPLLIVLLASSVVLWRSGGAVSRVAPVMAAVCLVLSFGSVLYVGHSRTGVYLPGWPVLHLPVLSSAAGSRFAAFVDLFAAVILALAVDRSIRWARRIDGRWPNWRVIAVGLFCIGSLFPLALAAPWPYATTAAHEPTILSSDAVKGLTAGSVVREYPPVSGGDAANEMWQATTGFRESFVDGYAIVPNGRGRASEAPPRDAVDEIFAGLYLRRLHGRFAESVVESFRAHAWDYDARAVMVLSGHQGSAAALAFVGQALGRPNRSDASGAVWLAPPG